MASSDAAHRRAASSDRCDRRLDRTLTGGPKICPGPPGPKNEPPSTSGSTAAYSVGRAPAAADWPRCVARAPERARRRGASAGRSVDHQAAARPPRDGRRRTPCWRRRPASADRARRRTTGCRASSWRRRTSGCSRAVWPGRPGGQRDPPGGARELHGHHPGALGGEQEVKQQAGKGEVAQMVGGELLLVAVHRQLEGDGHHAGVVHQDVEPAMLGGDPACSLAYRRQVRQVQGDGFGRRPRSRADHLVGGAVPTDRVPAGHHDVGAMGGQLDRSLVADTAVGTGDHGHPSRQVPNVVGSPTGLRRSPR